jgi:hypothetical protein
VVWAVDCLAVAAMTACCVHSSGCIVEEGVVTVDEMGKEQGIYFVDKRILEMSSCHYGMHAVMRGEERT